MLEQQIEIEKNSGDDSYGIEKWISDLEAVFSMLGRYNEFKNVLDDY